MKLYISCTTNESQSYGSGAISLLKELLKLDWRKRINAIDALKHPYFRNDPIPARPEDIPKFEQSHELDRREFRDHKAAPPPAPKGGTVGMGQLGVWDGAATGTEATVNSDSYNAYRQVNGARYPHHSNHRNGVTNIPVTGEERRPTWIRAHERPDTRLPPRPPPADFCAGDRSDGYRPLSRDLDRGLPPSRIRTGPNIDTYIPYYSSDGIRRDERRSRERDERVITDRSRDWRRDDRDRRRDDRDDRRYDRDRVMEYDERSRITRTRSRSRSPGRDHDRERARRREIASTDRKERDKEIYRR